MQLSFLLFAAAVLTSSVAAAATATATATASTFNVTFVNHTGLPPLVMLSHGALIDMSSNQTDMPSCEPTEMPTKKPTEMPTEMPTNAVVVTAHPTGMPTAAIGGNSNGHANDDDGLSNHEKIIIIWVVGVSVFVIISAFVYANLRARSHNRQNTQPKPLLLPDIEVDCVDVDNESANPVHL